MPGVYHGGLAGKARKMHTRARASRFHAQQLINDYLEPDPETLRSQRQIPVRGRSEFLPSLTYHNAAEPDQSCGQVGGFPVVGSSPAPSQVASATGAIRSDRASAETPIRIASQARSEGHSVRSGSDGGKTKVRIPSTVPFPRPVLRRLETSQRSARFTAGGFLLGCAMGGAAAAMILVVIRITLG